MEPSSDISIENCDEINKKSTINRIRKRKKQLFAELKKQIEFYLSDANLRKDRYFGHLIQINNYISIDTFLNCNKIKKITTNPDDIVKALETSHMLTVSKCKTKILRLNPIEEKQPEDIDRCTIYVEQLPPKADHDIVKSTFEKYGNVAYVSLPKFKSGNIKRFAFVEFENEDSVKQILEEFQKINEDSKILPEQLQSIISFNEGDKECADETSTIPCKRKFSDDQNGIKEKKMKYESLKINATGNKSVSKKKKKKEKSKKNSMDSNNKIENSINDNESLQKIVLSDNSTIEKTDDEVTASEEDINQSNDITNDTKEDLAKKKRKRNKGKKVKSHSCLSLQEIRIMSKPDWKKLRNQYLNMQRQKMSILKAQLQQVKFHKKFEPQIKKKNEPNISKSEVEINKKNNDDVRVKYEPGIILKVMFSNPIECDKSFKAEARMDPVIKYVDVVKNTEAYVRCDSHNSAKKIAAENRWPTTKLLDGEDEKLYWEKILRDRENRFIKQKETKKPRGRSKLINKAEKQLAHHVKFTEN
ncbi:la-related protein 7 [Daktulosphaira vitifoliae]|uniref:la-related protein 7 n=1 Tax=Daktulosphaira vitifoliae TaxID=58002 RepID=UPI0021AAD212|nr:la-related protein 7 [Daktulosphaira vitifoliae]